MSRLDLIRAGHTEVGGVTQDGTPVEWTACGLCEVPWPCDTAVVLDALAASEQRAEAAVKARLDWQADYDREKRQLHAMIDDARQRAEGREARLREAGNKAAVVIALLNSMVWSGEPHSETSEARMRDALSSLRVALAGTTEGEPDELTLPALPRTEGYGVVVSSSVRPDLVLEAADETPAPECRDGWHTVKPGESACMCGENRMELLL